MECKSKKRPNFRIVEGHTSDVDYEEFKRDFLNPYFLVEDIKKKYGISSRKYNNYREKVLKETGLWRKPSVAQHKSLDGTILDGNCRYSEFIQNVNDDFLVVKTIDYNTHYYGRYSDYETAVKVRDILMENNWDEKLGKELKQIYGKKRLRPSLKKAQEIFEEYEYKYFNEKDRKLVDIREEMGITKTIYRYLLLLLHEKHGKKANRWMYD